MGFDPITILAAFVPTLSYVAQRVTDYFTGGPKPRNAQEAIELKKADIEQLKALAELDNSDGAPSWVVAIRALQRPFAVFVILVMWSVYVYKVGIAAEDMMNLASAAVFYLFGQRTQMYLSKKPVK
jgi:hypothetical protein